MCEGVVRGNLHRTLVRAECVWQPARRAQQFSQVSVSLRVIGRNLERTTKGHERLVRPSGTGQGDSEVVQGLGVMRVESDRALVLENRLLDPTTRFQLPPPIVVRPGARSDRRGVLP